MLTTLKVPSLTYGPYHVSNAYSYSPTLAQVNISHAQRSIGEPSTSSLFFSSDIITLIDLMQPAQMTVPSHLVPRVNAGLSAVTPAVLLPIPPNGNIYQDFTNVSQPVPALATPVRPTASSSPYSPSLAPTTPQYAFTPIFSSQIPEPLIVLTPNISQDLHLQGFRPSPTPAPSPDAATVRAHLGEGTGKSVPTSGDPAVADSLLFSSDVLKTVLLEPYMFAHWGTGCASVQPTVRLDSSPDSPSPLLPPEDQVARAVSSLGAVIPDNDQLIHEGIDGFCIKSFPGNPGLQTELRRLMGPSWYLERKEDLARFLETSFVEMEKRWNCLFSGDHGPCKGSFKRRDTALSHILGVHINMLPFECGGECGDSNW